MFKVLVILCFNIIDKANSKFDLNIKEAFHINWKKPNLNGKKKSFNSHPFTIASVPLASFCLCFSIVFCISLSSAFTISTLIIGMFYCLNYTLLLLPLFIAHLVIDFIITM